MLHDPKRELAARKKSIKKHLNRPVVVNPFPVDDYSERRDAAIVAWFAGIFELYDIDPASPTRWEQAAWFLAFDLFPNFATIGKSNMGNPGTKAEVMKLFYKFQIYEQQPRKGSKYKNFLHDHRAECAACKLHSDRTLKVAMARARRQHGVDRAAEELLIRLGSMKALGII
jgi:hypothetical protein